MRMYVCNTCTQHFRGEMVNMVWVAIELLLISVYGLTLLKADHELQNVMVFCSSTVSCGGGDVIGLMTARECCIENPNGLAYRHANSSCSPCIVFGFSQEAFIGVEGLDHVVEMDFQKGAMQVDHNLAFHINDTAGTARKGKNMDYSIKTSRVKVGVRKQGPRNITLSFHADNIAQEDDENFTLKLISSSSLPSTDAVFFQNILNVIIKDNDILSITFERQVYTVVENEGSVEVCFFTSKGHMERTKVVVELSAKRIDHSTAGTPDINAAPQTIFFEASDSKQRLCVTYEVYDDIIDENNEEFIVKFTNIPNEQCVLGAISHAYIIIRDNDVPEFSIIPLAQTVLESAGEVEICVTTNSSLAREIEVTAEPGLIEGSHTNPAKDIEMNAITFTFLPSKDSILSVQTQCGVVRIIDDVIGIEPDEEFFITLISASPEGSFGNDYESHIIIRDDDVPVVDVEQPNISVPENETEVEVCLKLSIGITEQVIVTVATGQKIGAFGPLATAGADYTSTTRMLTFMPSDDRQSVCTTVLLTDDNVDEPNELFSVRIIGTRISPENSIMVGPNSESCVTIIDDDVPTVSIERPNVTVPENETEVEVCLVLSTGIIEQVVVTAETGPKTGATDQAIANSDYRTTTLMITFEPSSDGQRVCGRVLIIDDLLDEANELFSVRITSVSNPNIMVGMNAEICVTIIDDDVPEFNISPPMVTVTEPEGMVEVCITTDSPLARNIVVTAVTGPKSGAANQATADADYSTTTIMVTFMPSDQGTQELCGVVPIIDDMIGNEPNEELSVTLISSDPSGAKFGDRESCITIIDDDVIGIDFSTMDVVVNENNGTVTVCLRKNITTDGPITVVFDAKEETGVSNPANDTTDFQPGLGTVVFQPNDVEACGQVLIKDDDDPENPEVFMVTFTASNLVIPRPPNLPLPVAEVTIIDDDNIPDVLTCQFNEIQLVQRFTTTSAYRFMGTCEYTAVSSCNAIPGFDVRVTVDYISETLENGAVGLHVNNLRYVSREDGSFDDGGQTPQSSTPSGDVYSADGGTLVRVSMGPGQTNITFDSNTPSSDPLDTDIFIIHNWDDVDPTILISIRTPNNSAISDFCGLCGSRSGSLLRRDGTEADETSMSEPEVQSFATSYAVPARDQILRPQRRECGIVRNDTVIPFGCSVVYAVPVYSEDGREYSLCYEVFGRANSTLNLISDTCVNVNARYGPLDNPWEGNIIRAVGVRARGLSDNSCHNIRVDLEGCSANIETPDGNSQSLASMERFQSDGILVQKYPSRVRISAPNCENVMLVMWVICENKNGHDSIKFVIARGLNLRPSSHGLIGQFWNIPVTYTQLQALEYNITYLPADYDLSRVYVVTVEPESSPARSFLGHFYHLKWDETREPCLYVGNAQAGPSYEVPDPNDSVIEGRYREYILQGGSENLFATNYTYSQFEEGRCN